MHLNSFESTWIHLNSYECIWMHRARVSAQLATTNSLLGQLAFPIFTPTTILMWWWCWTAMWGAWLMIMMILLVINHPLYQNGWLSENVPPPLFGRCINIADLWADIARLTLHPTAFVFCNLAQRSGWCLFRGGNCKTLAWSQIVLWSFFNQSCSLPFRTQTCRWLWNRSGLFRTFLEFSNWNADVIRPRKNKTISIWSLILTIVFGALQHWSKIQSLVK